MKSTIIPIVETSATEMQTKAENLIARRDELVEHLRKHRREEIRAKSSLDRASIELGEVEDRMARSHREKEYTILTGIEWNELKADPRDPEGKTSREWAELFIERALRHDEDWNAMLSEFYAKQNDVQAIKEKALESQAMVMEFQELLMANGQEMRLYAALWQASTPTTINIGD